MPDELENLQDDLSDVQDALDNPSDLSEYDDPPADAASPEPTAEMAAAMEEIADLRAKVARFEETPAPTRAAAPAIDPAVMALINEMRESNRQMMAMLNQRQAPAAPAFKPLTPEEEFEAAQRDGITGFLGPRISNLLERRNSEIMGTLHREIAALKAELSESRGEEVVGYNQSVVRDVQQTAREGIMERCENAGLGRADAEQIIEKFEEYVRSNTPEVARYFQVSKSNRIVGHRLDDLLDVYFGRNFPAISKLASEHSAGRARDRSGAVVSLRPGARSMVPGGRAEEKPFLASALDALNSADGRSRRR